MRKGKNLAAAVLCIAVLTAFDQFTKYLAVHHLFEKPAIELIPGVFELHFLKNYGAAFGILQNQRWLFAVITFIVLALMGYCFCKIPPVKKYRVIHGIIVLLAGGAIGNLIDRLRMGYVVDFFYFKLIDFPIFNVADCYVVVAVACMLFGIFFVFKEEDLDELTDFLKR